MSKARMRIMAAATVAVLVLSGGQVFAKDWYVLYDSGADDDEEPSASPADEDATPAQDAVSKPRYKFSFGSYGRIQFTSDFDGGMGKDADVVSHGSRLEEAPYLELHLYNDIEASHADFNLVISMALFDLENLFHYSGETSSVTFAVRNLYMEANDIYETGAFLWVGSRMYRGDDIYLLDFWPMDNLNTYGGGAGWRNERFDVSWQVGVNRLKNDYQLQEVEVPGRGFGAETITTLDRQRVITSLGFTHKFFNLSGELGLKYKLYGEFHYLPDGTRQLEDNTAEFLPEDYGYTLGAQAGLWGFGRNSFVNLFLKYGRGLAAYNELAVPYGVDLEKKTTGASSLLFGFSGNYEYKMFGILFGGYLQRWLDAMPQQYDLYDYADLILVTRPMVFIGDHFRLAGEVSFQRRESPGTQDIIGTSSVPTMVKISLVPGFALQPGSLSRPEIRLIYTLACLNEGARYLYPQGDKRRDKTVQHFLGLGVEWWFNAYGY